VLRALPTVLPVTTLGALASVLPLSAQIKAQLAALLPQLTQPISLSYTYQVHTTYWVEPTTGLVVDLQREEIRSAGLSASGKTLASGIPVFDVTTAYTSTSMSNAVNDAKDKKDTIDLFSTTLPLVLLIIGILAILGALLVFLLSRRPSGRAQPTPAGGDTPPDAAAG